MNKKDRRRVREFGKRIGMKRGDHEEWLRLYPKIKSAIIFSAIKERIKND